MRLQGLRDRDGAFLNLISFVFFLMKGFGLRKVKECLMNFLLVDLAISFCSVPAF